MRFIYCFLLPLCSVLLLQGCDVYTDTGFQKRFVVEAYLVVGRDLPEIRLTHTVPADEPYRFEDTAVENADISVSLLRPTGSVAQKVDYSADSAGIFTPDQSLTVQPRRTYRLKAVINDNNTVTATTTVPNSYQLTGSVPDSIVYQTEPQIGVTLVPDEPDTARRQKQFVFNLISEDYHNASLTPFYQDQLEGEDTNRKDYRNNSSGLVSEGNFEIKEDGTINIWVPWIGFAFYGPNKIVTNSIDENLYDFIRTQGVQTGGSTLSPGEIPNVTYNIDGGIGIFGSIATDTVSTYLLPSK